MGFNKVKYYRKRIEELETENRQLKDELNGLNESGYADLVKNTKEIFKKYNGLMKEASDYREEYEKLVQMQGKAMTEYKKDIDNKEIV